MLNVRIGAFILIIFGVLTAWFVYSTQTNPNSSFPFKFGLDLSGGTHLVYKADTSSTAPADVPDAMTALRDVIERRVNLFGVSEPIVQVEQGGAFAGTSENRLIVELPGVTDINQAIKLIGQTPLLEFKLINKDFDASKASSTDGTLPADAYIPTELTGRYLKGAQLQFGQGSAGGLSNEPTVVLEFNSDGAKLFEDITRAHVGDVLAIFLDGKPISTPVIREAISGGRATISGTFTPDEARLLVRDLNFGALPLPIELESTQTIGASLGAQALASGITAGLIGLVLVALFMVLWYRLPGVIAVLSLAIYIFVMLAVFKLIPVTLTAAGIAGFILSIGMAVDANVLIFSRMEEELREGRKSTQEAIRDGFARAWLAIRDGNLTSILSAVILFWFGSSLIQGFALTFGIGVLVSMFSAITVSRTLLLALGNYEFKGAVRFLFGTGLHK